MLQYTPLLLLVCSVQGQSSLEPGTRIVGGSNANIEDFPYMVSLRQPNGGSSIHFCGGSVIAPKYVLTAAHCVRNRDKSNLIVVVGATKRSERGEQYKVDKIIRHENFDTNKTLINDIALVKVTEEFKYSDKVKPIDLPSSNTPAGENLVVSGWGYFTKYRRSHDSLQKLTVKSISVEDCVKNFDKKAKERRGRRSFAIVDSNICTFNRVGQGFCQGDSGGALIKDKEVVGIVSFGVPCADGFPDIYTRVYSYLDWIKNHME